MPYKKCVPIYTLMNSILEGPFFVRPLMKIVLMI